MIRGRVTGVNDIAAKQWQDSLQRERGGSRLTSERNLTWIVDPPESNAIVEGQWWAADATAPEVSLEADYAQSWGISLGDELQFDIGGQQISAKVTSIRTLEWESMSPNFFIIFSPGALQDFPATYMTSFFLQRSDKRVLNELLTAYPTITVIEIDALIAQIQEIVAQVSQAVELVLGLVLISGCLVLVASIQASRDSRMSEHALIRALGGSRRLIGSSLAAEFLLLGAFAGIVAVFGAELTVGILQSQVFNLSASLHPWIWLLGPVAGALIIATVGLLGSRSLVDTPPMMVLRGLN
jgi:putative ABC transport system permease protein